MLQLCVAAAIVEEWRPVLSPRRLHFSHDDGVVTGIVHREGSALDDAEHVIEHGEAILGSAVAHAFEAIDIDDREAPRDLFLTGGENVRHEAGRRGERIVSRRGPFDADEHEWGLKTDGAESAHRHALIGAISRLCSHNGDTGRKPAEYAAEFVWTYAQVLKAGEMKRLKRKRGFSTTLVGMKSPATPTRRSAISLRRDRAFAALLRK